MSDTPRFEKLKSILKPGTEIIREPLVLKNDIAVLDPEPIAKGAFGLVYHGKILNPIGLLAERVVWGEENPRWLGLDIAYAEPEKEIEKENVRLPKPITDPVVRARVYEAARRLWQEYLERRSRDGGKADEEYLALLNLIDPVLDMDRQIVVKVLHPATKSGDADTALTRDFVRRFIKENNILRRLRHANIVRRLGLVHDPRLGWCMLLEHIDGETLDEHMKRFPERRMPVPELLRMARELVSALEYTQGAGIIHRDLKPQNIMVRTQDCGIVLMDFGIGKWVDDSETRPLTMPGDRPGTPRYMAPEQVNGAASVSRATDIYQLSTVLFEMVTGHAAYEHMEIGEVFAALYDVRTEHPASARDHVPELSRDLECLIEVGRAKEPEDRWTIREFREKLDRIIAQKQWSAEPPPAPLTREQFESALLDTRIRRRECQWQEKVLEVRVHDAGVRERIEKAREFLLLGAHEQAQALAETLRRQVERLPRRYEGIKEELQGLDREIERARARMETGSLLLSAEREFAAQRYPDVGATLDLLKERGGAHVPESPPDLAERFRKLSDEYDANHRSLVELFTTLRNSLIRKVAERVQELLRSARGGEAVAAETVRDLLQQLDLAENNLATLDRAKVGPEPYDQANADIRSQRAVLEDLLARIP